jgi:hypothetical protein
MSNDTITFGNGNGDEVFGSNSNDRIIFGNGNEDTALLYSGAGGDFISTGTGSADLVEVGGHSNADTFGFAPGTNGSSYTTVRGAGVGDHVIAASHNLANSYTNEGDVGAGALATLYAEVSNNHTLIGNDGTNTFIVTDVNNAKGDIEIVGVFNSSTVSGHVLTLG